MSDCNENDSTSKQGCDCGEALKQHLRECAGYGQRPPLFEGFKANSDSCATPKAPPIAAEKCCAPPPPKIVVFRPKCEVPPTETFTCPASACNPPQKQKCCPPPQPCKEDDNDRNLCPAVECTDDTSSTANNKCPARSRGMTCNTSKSDADAE